MKLETSREGWSVPRAICAADDTLVSASATTMKYANIPTGAYSPRERQNAIEVCWTLAANNNSCVAYIFAARNNGDIVLVWYGTITAGTQVATDGRFYVDTIATTAENWITSVTLVDYSAANRMSRLTFDSCGYQFFFCQYTGISSTSVQAKFSGY